ncbi:hypothetical protein [Anaeromicropila herbilytica]|uniref:Uncharacterized protein n=1 Tax=Anaeromicropila herbilytica TaxID=2785025 RepID=A0A7R7IBG1_9FIRM|nr:hypothetical protein [Anaeromicropila herbilytica]BCN29572.1 hypothetical protein bsdtb5_08670 [Anaeromicropila herbilytica]
MAKKKMPFIKLSIVFIIIIMTSLFYSWGYSKNNQESTMMSKSMGDMMGENHLKNITIRDLLVQEKKSNIDQSKNSTASHHDSGKGLLKLIHNITTITIVALIPFIIAGTIFLVIIWFDKS